MNAFVARLNHLLDNDSYKVQEVCINFLIGLPMIWMNLYQRQIRG
jgi:hypothetical protein